RHAGPARIRENRIDPLPDQGLDENVGPGDHRRGMGLRFWFSLGLGRSHVRFAHSSFEMNAGFSLHDTGKGARGRKTGGINNIRQVPVLRERLRWSAVTCRRLWMRSV